MKYMLIVEDDTTLREGLAAALANASLSTCAAANLAEARRMFAKRAFDLLLVDYNLPDGSGMDFCREATAQRDVPVIFLTVRDSEMDELAAFRAGAWDYVKKPFSLSILQERIHAALRRHTASHLYEDGPFRFDFAALTYTVRGEKVLLSATEQKLLSIFCNHKGQLLERQVLVDKVWGCDDYIDAGALSVTVKRLRDKLGADCIGTVYGLGYIWKGARG